MCGTRTDTFVCEREVASLPGGSNDPRCGAVDVYEVIMTITITIIIIAITKCPVFRQPSVYQTVQPGQTICNQSDIF